MRVLIAPDSFSGTLSARAAADAIAAGWRHRRPGDVLDVLPVADGGLGTVDVLAHLGSPRTAAVEDALGRRVEATWLRLGDTAVVESATACGRDLLPSPSPLAASSSGVGELVCAALGEDVRRVVVGVGNTACTDGGAGLAQALGAWLLGEDGHPLDPGGAALARLARVERSDLDPRLGSVSVVAACDVDAPLLGPEGAARGYGPQKGATPADVDALEAALARYAALAGGDPDAPGAGAGGGLGYGLATFAGATLARGADVVLDLLGLAARVPRADLVVTGEGSFDWQSLRGKAPAAVARAAAAEGVACVVIAGQVGVGRRELGAHGVDAAYALADVAGSVEEAEADAAGWLAEVAASVAGEWSR
ncbi:MAG TPA: glycerate kinase [Frankiaceae bacterium]|jgi:glycerate kinase|nr:glycerate kinase [Frankiaceae bacterium]